MHCIRLWKRGIGQAVSLDEFAERDKKIIKDLEETIKNRERRVKSAAEQNRPGGMAATVSS